jgi:galactoside O-acetyltransferase
MQHRFDRTDVPIHGQGVTSRGVVIEDNVWIGMNVSILDGVRIGNGSIVGAGAVVTKDVPANAIVVGNPARVLRFREHGGPHAAADATRPDRGEGS